MTPMRWRGRAGDLFARFVVATLFVLLSINLTSDFVHTHRVTGLLLLVSEALVAVLTVVRRRTGTVDRALVRLCLAKDPAARPTARELMAETDAARSLGGRPPDLVTRTLIQRPLLTPEADTAPVPVPVSAPGPDLTAPDLPLGRATAQSYRRRRGWRPLAAAAIVAGLAGAAATAGITLTSAQRPSHAAQSEGHAAVQTTSPVIFAPPPAAARTSRPAVRKRSAPAAPAPVHTQPPVVAFTQPATTDPPPPQTTAPPTTPPPTRTTAPPPATSSPTPSSTPTPAYGGY